VPETIMAIEVKKLEGWFEKQKLMKILKNDYDNFYMLFDLDNFNFLLGNSSFLYSKVNNEITGVLLNYYHSSGFKDIWLYGDIESTSSLLGYVDKSSSVIHVRFNDNLKIFDGSPKVYREYCMVNERPAGNRDENVKLLTQDKYVQYSKLISQWSNTRFKTMEQDEYRNLLNYSTIYGYFIDGDLVSVATLGAVWKDWFVVSSVFTDPSCRNKGYVQKLISSMLEHYSNLDKAILFVNKENAPAVKAYTNLGFRIYSEDLWVDYATGLVP
jgi:ribosomal protein S18 acetylase RimI-like enzyme